MLSVGVIGIGNCGNQVAKKAMEELGCDVLALNSSINDLSTLPDTIPQICLGDEKGAGKNRLEAKKFLKASVLKMIEEEAFKTFMNEKDIIFIVSSTGGGTGSGMAPVLSKFIRQSFHDADGKEKVVVLVGVLPKLSEAYTTQVNTLEYLTELTENLDDPTYMMYDNDRLSKEPTHVMMNTINSDIVQDIKVLSGYYNTSTPFSSIDEKDMKMLVQTQGRLFIASLRDVKEKDIDEKSLEEMLIDQVKRNSHAEIDRNQVVTRTGIITNLNEALNNQFDTHLTEVQKFIGSPVEEFEHIVINEERSIDNNVFLIMAGLSSINDRINKVKDRIDEIEELQKNRESENALDGIDLESMNAKRNYRSENTDDTKKPDLADIFSGFGV